MSYKFNIHPDDCRYIVNEDKRKIICLIEDTSNLFIEFADKNFEIPHDCLDYPFYNNHIRSKYLHDKLLMPKRFWGVATCAEDDEWDEEKGKLLAFSKAKDKLNKSFFKRANLYISTFDKSIDRAVMILNTLGDKLAASTEHRYTKLAELFGDNENVVSAN